MSNSPLVDITIYSPNCNKPRNHEIDRITIHNMCGNCKAKHLGEEFARATRKASSNYGIDSDGIVALYVDEENRSWCSNSRENDNRAITIEVASDGTKPDWHVCDKAMKKLIELCADICKRNNIDKLVYTGDTNGNMTLHRWFADTDCPGKYLESKMSYIALEVNKILHPMDKMWRVCIGAYTVKSNAEKKVSEARKKGFNAYIIECEVNKDGSIN